MSIKQTVGIIGGVLIFLGVFTPVDALPVLGNASYIGKWELAGAAMLALAATTLILAALEKYRLLWATGIPMLLLVTATFVMLLSEDTSSMKAGWLLLFAGSIAVIGTAIAEEIELRS